MNPANRQTAYNHSVEIMAKARVSPEQEVETFSILTKQ
jgi:hypothetical protein